MASLEFQPMLAYSPPASCRISRCQSMTKPSLGIFEVLSVQSYDEKIGAFSHHLDACLQPSKKRQDQAF